MNLEQAGRALWLQVKRCNVWLVIAAIIAIGALWYKAESDRIGFEYEQQRAKQRRDFERAMGMTMEAMERSVKEDATPP